MLLGGETYALLQKRSAQSAQHGTGRRLSNAEGPVQNLADCSCPRGGGSFGGGGGIGDTGDWETGQPRNACGFA